MYITKTLNRKATYNKLTSIGNDNVSIEFILYKNISYAFPSFKLQKIK